MELNKSKSQSGSCSTNSSTMSPHKQSNRLNSNLEEYTFNEDLEMMDPMNLMRNESSVQSSIHSSSETQMEKDTVKISTSQLLDDIYDIYLVEIPDSLEEALTKAEDTKIKIISGLFASRILNAELELSSENDEETQQSIENYLKELKQQRSVVEKYVNACLFDRIQGEKKFKFMRNLQSQIEKRLQSEFKEQFQKGAFLNEASIIKKFHREFWCEIDVNFENIVQEEIIKACERKYEIQSIKVIMQQKFVLNYLIEKTRSFLYEELDEFIVNYSSSYEENWNKFIRQKLDILKNDQSVDFSLIENDSLQILFNIMIRLPVRTEIRREIAHLNAKVMQFAFANRLEINLQEFWTKQYEIDQYQEDLLAKITEKETQQEKEDFVAELFFCIFYYFIDSYYTAIDRELLRELIYTLLKPIRKGLMQGQEFPLSFYLTVIEKELTKPTLKCTDVYLKDIAKDKYMNEISQLSHLGIEEALEKTTILNLQKVSVHNNHSRHILICISGFLTEDIEKKEYWRHAVNHYKHSEVYALTWNSLGLGNFLNEGYYKDRNKSTIRAIFNAIKVGRKQFKYALEQTKVAGSLLALFLMKSDFANDKAVSLLGHSLGTVVIIQCLTVLNFFHNRGFTKAGRLIHDVILWAGAAVLNPNGLLSEIHQRSYICGMANGKISNCYSNKDYVLKYIFMGYMSKLEPIGIKPIFEEIPYDGQEDEDHGEVVKFHKLKRAFNYDCTVEAPGHSMYSINGNLIFERIPYSF